MPRQQKGYNLERYVASQPSATDRFSMKWDGEWYISYEVFRDLGLAFAAVLILIYVLITGWFKSFLIPLPFMTAIPFSPSDCGSRSDPIRPDLPRACDLGFQAAGLFCSRAQL